MLDSDWSWVMEEALLVRACNNGGNAAPEPATLALFGLGLAGLAVSRSRLGGRRKK